MRSRVLLGGVLLLLAACQADGQGGKERTAGGEALAAGGGAEGESVCRVARAPAPLPETVREASGVAASRTRPGILWTHNDSGEPLLHAVDAEGRPAGEVRVTGATVEDWEDLALGPCPSGSCLYVADIGDNQAERPGIIVYRVPEPAPGDRETRPAERLDARYPDGAHDAEALFVLPPGRIYVLTKGETGPVALYRFPEGARPGETATLERVKALSGEEVEREARITGASATPDGRWVALRTLESLSLYPAEALVGGGSASPRRMDLRPLKEAQGEGVSLGADGTVVLTSEGEKKKDSATLSRLACDLR